MEAVTARARHDQPAQRFIDPDETVVRCADERCRRSIRVVFVPGAQRYICPYCDARLPVAVHDGGAQ